MQKRLGCLLLRLYGMSEAFMTTVNRPGDRQEILEERDGRAVPGVEVQAWDDSGEQVAAGHPGEGVLRGPHRCLGFVGDPERTRAAITPDGWMHTGDLLTIDEEGYATVVGRKKEVINRGGYKFSPREVENLLQMHSAVERIAIVRMADARLGEKACAFVVLSPGAALTLDDVKATLEAEHVAPYKWPERLEIVDELPTTASGKIQKYVLEKRLAEEDQAR
jgi:non-ribosomal peptide synthetase component E (peptide arylation enzyme)